MSLRKMPLPLALLISSLAVVTAGSALGSDHRKGERAHPHEAFEIIVDTDMGLDDVRAIFTLLADTTVDIRGIITVEGSASIGRGLDNLLGLLESTGTECIPVYRGHDTPHLHPPPWRDVANSLGGVSFPPAREASPLTGTATVLRDLLAAPGGEIDYVALGPLGNLALLGSEYPGSLELIETIWIPVSIDEENEITSWNLRYDEVSTEKVLSEAPNVVLIDLSIVPEREANGAFSRLEGSSPATRWLNALRSKEEARASHFFLFDEVVAAAVMHPDLLNYEDQAYRSKFTSSGTIGIEPAARGNIRVARPTNAGTVTDILKEYWERSPIPCHVRHEDVLPPRVLLKTFHGHLGPYVVLGFRMGRLALRATGSTGHFGITAEVHSILKPPASCLIDGIQLGSGCTMGKRNIEVHAFDGPAYAIFETERGARVKISLRDEIPELIRELIEKEGVEAAGEELLRREIDTLFDVEPQ